jgi:hypothetical protein
MLQIKTKKNKLVKDVFVRFITKTNHANKNLETVHINQWMYKKLSKKMFTFIHSRNLFVHWFETKLDANFSFALSEQYFRVIL